MELKVTPVNKASEEEGVWTSYYGVELKIARANNDTYKREFNRLSKPYQRQIDRKELPESVSLEILAKAAAKGLLKDWRNFIIDGQEVEYSYENAVQLLTNDTDCLAFVNDFAADMDNFITYEEDEVVKK